MKKKLYKVTYTETIVHTFYVDAYNRENAEQVFEEGSMYGEFDFSGGEVSDIQVEFEEMPEDKACTQ